MSRRNGIIITEMELDVENLEMLDGEIMPIDEAPIEPDASLSPEDETIRKQKGEPADREEPTTTIEAKPGEDKLVHTGKGEQPDSVTPSNADADLVTLFGHLWPLGTEVKLDSTAVRSQFIRQKDYLKDNGYQFNGKNQTWYT